MEEIKISKVSDYKIVISGDKHNLLLKETLEELKETYLNSKIIDDLMETSYNNVIAITIEFLFKTKQSVFHHTLIFNGRKNINYPAEQEITIDNEEFKIYGLDGTTVILNTEPIYLWEEDKGNHSLKHTNKDFINFILKEYKANKKINGITITINNKIETTESMY